MSSQRDMQAESTPKFSAFAGMIVIADGDLIPVALRAKEIIDQGTQDGVLVFDNSTSQTIEIDYRGDANAVREYLLAQFPSLLLISPKSDASSCFEALSTESTTENKTELPKLVNALETAKPRDATDKTYSYEEESVVRGRGRPKLGVVAREVTLLPRHWEWLNSQPGGASVALRKLVEAAKKESVQKDLRRRAQDTTFRFMSIMVGNLERYEEASRALYAGDGAKFEEQISTWPQDIQKHLKRISINAFTQEVVSHS